MHVLGSAHSTCEPRHQCLVNVLCAGHRVGMRRSGDVEGVRQSSGNWQRGSNISWCKCTVVRNLDPSMLRNMQQRL